MSKLGVDLTIAFRSLVQHRRRSLFLGIAIAAVTALLVLLNGLSTGVRETMIDTATTLSTGHVNVGGFYKVTQGQAAPVVTDYKKVLAVAKQTGVGKESLRRWVAQAEIDAGEAPGVTSEENEEIKRLRAENRRLREDVAILKAATTFFVGELDPRNR